MDSSTTNMTRKINISPAPFAINQLDLVSPNYYSSSSFTLNRANVNNHYAYPDIMPSLNYGDLLRTWNYHRLLTSPLTTDRTSDNSSDDHYSRNCFYHQYYPSLVQQASQQQLHNENMLKKFHRDTLVNLDTGESKNIQQLTKNDLLRSAKQSHQYSSLLARVDYIGSLDKSTGRVELQFYIDDVGKTASCYVLQAIPFFVHQHSCWSSISPEQTQRICGLKCRQLECGDVIIAITEQRKSLSLSKINDKRDHSQQTSNKCAISGYMNGQTSSSNKRYKASNEHNS